jgi:cellulose synthase/poly-beta-1,6-N-acetylglucosamine synthase-like glycosyltransferase
VTLLNDTIAIADAVMDVTVFGILLIGAAFLTLPVLYLVNRLRGKPAPDGSNAPTLADEAIPDILVQLPVFNEQTVVTGLLQAVAALEWPRHKLHIQLLDDSSDQSAEIGREAIENLKRRGYRAEHIRRDDRRGYKAGALAAGLVLSDAPFVAMLDADFRPPANWLRTLVPRLIADPRAGFAQSRCEFSNAGKNWLTRAQGLLFDAHFLMEQDVRARAGMLFQFNGTGGIWRRAAIEAAGGWSADSLCEDLDLTVRAALAGWHGIFVMNPAVGGLVPDRIQHWQVQQRRWASGFAQVARKLVHGILGSDWSLVKKISAGFLILYQAALPLIAIASVASVFDFALRGGDFPPFIPLLAAVALLTMLVAISMTLPPYIALSRGGAGRYVLTLIALPPLILYLSIANGQAIVAAYFGRSETFKRTPKTAAPLP